MAMKLLDTPASDTPPKPKPLSLGKRFRDVPSPQQGILGGFSIDDWVERDDMVRSVHAVIETLDVSAMEDAYRGGGAPAYPPRYVLGLLVFGMILGLRSGYELQDACKHDTRFVWLAGGERLNHELFTDFRRKFGETIKKLWEQTVLAGINGGFITLEQLAIDGSKFAANCKRKGVEAKDVDDLLDQVSARIAKLLAEAEEIDAARERQAEAAQQAPEDPQGAADQGQAGANTAAQTPEDPQGAADPSQADADTAQQAPEHPQCAPDQGQTDVDTAAQTPEDPQGITDPSQADADTAQQAPEDPQGAAGQGQADADAAQETPEERQGAAGQGQADVDTAPQTPEDPQGAADQGQADADAAQETPEERQGVSDPSQADAERALRVREELRHAEAQRQRLLEAKQAMERNNWTAVGETDPQAPVQKTQDGKRPGFNAQIAVDADSRMVVGQFLTDALNDTDQLARMCQQIMDLTSTKPQLICTDSGFASEQSLRYLVREHLNGYINQQEPNNNGRFGHEHFSYDQHRDLYICPAGHELPYKGDKKLRGDKLHRQYRASSKCCRNCPLRQRCITDKATYRQLVLVPHSELVSAMRTKVASDEGKQAMIMRSSTVESTFGLMKAPMGMRQFLLRGVAGAAIELSLACLAINVRKLAQWLLKGGTPSLLDMRPATTA
jgi:transposase